MSLHKIKGRIWADTSGSNGGNFGAIILSSEIIMIDTGMFPSLTGPIKEFIVPNLGTTVSKVLFTHYHPDHLFGAQVFNHAELIGSSKMRNLCLRKLEKEWTNERLMKEAETVKNDNPLFWENMQKLTIRIPETTFDEEYSINDSIHARLIGGHTAGSSIVVIEPEHVLFSGDLIFNQAFPYAGDPSCDPEVWINALRTILGESYEVIIPGHGPPCDNDTVQVHIDLFTTLKERILEAIENNISPSKFIDSGLVPEYHNNGYENRIKSTIERWFEFYKSRV